MMRTAVAAILCGLVATHALAAPARPAWTHTRPLSQSAADLLTRAAQRSVTVRAELQALEQTDVVVYLVDAMAREGSGVRASLAFVAFAAGTRYVLVTIDRWRLHPCEAIAWLGHELQHALEIASAPEVKEAAQMARFYHRIGWEHQRDRFETDAARAAGHRVRDELTGFSR